MNEERVSKFLFEYPLTLGVCTLLLLFYFISLFIPEPTLQLYFYSYPKNFSFINWLLSTLIHANIAHLFWNLVFLFFLGRAVEAKLGKAKWLLFYITAGIVSGLSDSFVRGILHKETNPTVGASGAIAGIAIVAALVSPYTLPTTKKNFPFPTFFVAWLMIYYDLTNAFKPDKVAHWSHIGGYISVLVAAYFLSEEEKKKLWNAFLLNLLFFVLSLILLFLISNR
ncbi:MAG: rhomboid family intramembrane serine protease [Leptospiraceae bacterium]|nr:rhomboid family intramembrane serine protease [Leptospiraceae bacterium]